MVIKVIWDTSKRANCILIDRKAKLGYCFEKTLYLKKGKKGIRMH